ncbi:SDR family oxidoreductase [Streptomyces sp. SM13]|uniref:SDR family oxidoreductase n=1 Tax=Streptomyces sp. SM13 TaxID=1983803 RepID=UPI0021564ABE|nr:SDR family oxidoreductase [Streptomyces sp. SM13]
MPGSPDPRLRQPRGRRDPGVRHGLGRVHRQPGRHSLAVRFGGDAPTLTSALTTSGHHTGIAAGSLVAGRALGSSLGLTGPALVGAVFAALTLLPLIALALRGTTGPSRIVAHHTTDTAAEPAATATATATTEYGSSGVRINAVCPGTISTPMVDAMVEGGELDRDQAEGGQGQAIDRLGTAEEIAQAVLWLCNDGASYVTGVALPVDGGYIAQ